MRLHSGYYGDTPDITPFALARATSPLGLRPRLGRDDAVEAAGDCVQKRVVAERAADRLAPPQGGEGGVVRVPCREDRRSAARSISLHAHEPVVAARGAPDAICLPGRTAIHPSRRSAAASVNARSGRRPPLEARPAYLPTCAVRGRDLQQPFYVETRRSILPDECRLRVDIASSQYGQRMTAICAQPPAGVDVKRT
jgi:hypothetical protein